MWLLGNTAGTHLGIVEGKAGHALLHCPNQNIPTNSADEAKNNDFLWTG